MEGLYPIVKLLSRLKFSCMEAKNLSKASLYLILTLIVLIFSLVILQRGPFSISKFLPIVYDDVPDFYQINLPLSERKYVPSVPDIVIKKPSDFVLPKLCVLKNASVWQKCDTVRCLPYKRKLDWTYPLQTNTGEKTSDFLQRLLKIAWGLHPPSIDLYLRAGCAGIMEMKYLFESIELFWPRFLGSIIIVLDAGDESILNDLLPKTPNHRYIIAFEHIPCLPGRVFNQYSYLNLDRHSTADYVVTIDSDCVFHTPVTPDLIFRQGKVILLSSKKFQIDFWRGSIDAIFGVSYYEKQYMVTQPVVFALSTFKSFREWFYRLKDVCYEDRIATLSSTHYPNFCWMCQLGTYLERGSPNENETNKYWYFTFEESNEKPILRYAIHLKYESYEGPICDEEVCYKKDANEIIKQALCRAFGSSIFKECKNQIDFSYVDRVTFTYAHYPITNASSYVRAQLQKQHSGRLLHLAKLPIKRI